MRLMHRAQVRERKLEGAVFPNPDSSVIKLLQKAVFAAVYLLLQMSEGFWQTGSIGGGSWEGIRMVLPFLAVGMVLAIVLVPSLNVLPLSALDGAVLLLLADVAGRYLGRPGEMEVGIVTAFIGAPVFIAIVGKAKVEK